MSERKQTAPQAEKNIHTAKHTGGSIMLQGCIPSARIEKLLMGRLIDLKILENPWRRPIRSHKRLETRVEQDNEPKHTARIIPLTICGLNLLHENNGCRSVRSERYHHDECSEMSVPKKPGRDSSKMGISGIFKKNWIQMQITLFCNPSIIFIHYLILMLLIEVCGCNITKCAMGLR